MDDKNWDEFWEKGGWKPPEEEKPPEAPVYEERREKNDWVVKIVPIISAIGWLSAIVSAMFLHVARPDRETFWTTLMGVRVVSSWNRLYVELSLIMAVEVFLVCFLGFMFNLMRHRRKTDRFRKSILVLWVLSVGGIAYLSIRFGHLIFR